VATWNVRGITNKEDELELELLNRKIDTAIFSETKKKRTKVQKNIYIFKYFYIYIMIYSGVPEENCASSGVAILVRKELKNKILNYDGYPQEL
jgi:exonuclease III